MPRPKKYTSQEELSNANREKSKRYYQRNSEKISESNKKKYQPKKSYYVYKVTLPSTGQYYIGSRGCYGNPDLDVKYTGSQSKWKLTKEERLQLVKEILKRDIKSMSDAIQYESEIISKYIDDPLNENYFIPSKNFTTDNKVTVKNSDGKIILISKDDPRYVSGNLKFMHTGKVTVRDSNKVIMVDVNDPRYVSGELKFMHHNMVIVNENNQKVSISKEDPRYISGQLKSASKNTVLVYDETGKKMRVNIDDPRYVSGELKFIATGKVSVRDKNGNCFYVNKDDPRFISGELVGSSKGYWSWRTKIEIEDQQKTALELSRIYNIKVKDLKAFLDQNNIKYTKIS